MICRYYLTYKCNATCDFCRIWDDESAQAVIEQDLTAVKRNLGKIRALKINKMVFTGGEPLMRSDLPQILQYAKRLGFHNTLITNGLLFPERAQEFTNTIDKLYVSFDYHNAQEHDRSRGQECFGEAVESIYCAKKIGIKSAILFTISRDSVMYLPEMIELADSMQTDIVINPVHHFFGLEGFENESLDYILRYFKRNNVYIDLAGMELLRQGGNNIAKPVCRAIKEVLTISPDGNILLPCINYANSRIPIEGDLKKMLSSNTIKDCTKLQGKMDLCDGCKDLDYLGPSLKSGGIRYQALSLVHGAESILKNVRKDVSTWKLFRR